MKHRWRWHKPLKSPARGMEAGARERLAGRPAEGRRHGRAVWLAEAGGAGRGGAGDQVGWSHRERARGPASAARVVAEARRRQRGAGRPGTVGPRGCWSTRAGGRPPRDRGDRGDSWSTGSTRREGGKEAQGRARAPSDLAGPSGRGGPRGRPRRRPSACRAEAPRLSPPSPSQPGASAPAGKEGVSVPGAPTRQAPSGGVSAPPPTLRLAGKRARERKDGATDADGMGWEGCGEPPTPLPCPAPPRPAPPGPRLPPRQGRRDAGGTEGGRGQDRTGPDRTGPDRTNPCVEG